VQPARGCHDSAAREDCHNVAQPFRAANVALRLGLQHEKGGPVPRTIVDDSHVDRPSFRAE